MDCSMPGFPVHHQFQSLVKVMSIESVCVKSLSHVQLFVTPCTVAYQLPPSLGFSRQEYWSGLPFPSPGDLPDPGIEPGLLHCRQTLYHGSHQGSSSSQWCHPTISSSVVSSCLQSFPASGSFPVSWLLASSGHSIGASASASVLWVNFQSWFPLGLTGLISLLSEGLLFILPYFPLYLEGFNI